MIDNIYEELEIQQREDEEAALQLVIEHEIRDSSGLEAAKHWTKEIQRRQNNDN